MFLFDQNLQHVKKISSNHSSPWSIYWNEIHTHQEYWPIINANKVEVEYRIMRNRQDRGRLELW